MPYDEAYSRNPFYFGSHPERILVEHHHLIDRSKPVLDIGAGQGRNSLFLAAQGFAIEAVDTSGAGIQTITAKAAETNLSLKAERASWETYGGAPGGYAAILLFGLLQEMRWEEIERLLKQTRTWTAAQGLVFVSGFSTEDPGFNGFVTLESVGPNSFLSPTGRVRTFLEPDQILTLFAGYEVVHHWEGLGSVHRHGDGPVEQHHQICALFRKQ